MVKVVGMIEKVEGECSELVAKLETIENDKKKIEVRQPAGESSLRAARRTD